jgi:hypothetical protein
MASEPGGTPELLRRFGVAAHSHRHVNRAPPGPFGELRYSPGVSTGC